MEVQSLDYVCFFKSRSDFGKFSKEQKIASMVKTEVRETAIGKIEIRTCRDIQLC